MAHLGFLVLPDYEHLIKNDKYVSILLKINKAVNEALRLLGGRLTNPTTYLPGGFTISIRPAIIEKILNTLRSVGNDLWELTNIILSIEFPELTDPSAEYVSLRGFPDVTVPIEGPYIIDSSKNTHVVYDNYREIFSERYIDTSTSKKCLMFGENIFYTGPRARLLNYLKRELNATNKLNYLIRKYETTLKKNPFSNIYAKIIESLLVYENLIQSLNSIDVEKLNKVKPGNNFKSGFGVGVVEAPRGLLIHYYELSPELRVIKADIITPTVMFSKHIEASSEALVRDLLNSSKNHNEVLIKRYVETLIRAYDPCIPCAVHVIKKG